MLDGADRHPIVRSTTSSTWVPVMLQASKLQKATRETMCISCKYLVQSDKISVVPANNHCKDNHICVSIGNIRVIGRDCCWNFMSQRRYTSLSHISQTSEKSCLRRRPHHYFP